MKKPITCLEQTRLLDIMTAKGMSMVVHVNGILRGKHVELDQPISDLPDGSPVSLDVRPRDPSIAEKKNLVKRLCGALANDASIGPIFEEIERSRRLASERPVNFDDPS